MATRGNEDDPGIGRPRRAVEPGGGYTPRYARGADHPGGVTQDGSDVPRRARYSASAHAGAHNELYDVEREGLREPPPQPVAQHSAQSSSPHFYFQPLRDERSRGFGLTIARTTIGTLFPGTGLFGTRRAKTGLIIFVCVLLGTVIAALIGKLRPEVFIKLLTNSIGLTVLGVVLAALAVFWVVLIAGTYLISRPRRMTLPQRIVGSVVVFLMSALVATPTSLASAYAFTTGAVVSHIFGNNGRSLTRPNITNEANPFADKERLNILLLGGDSGAGRDNQLGVRTDTVILASIDTHTGNTVLIQLPRNLENVPFPEGSALAKAYPNGRIWDGVHGTEDSYMLNAVWNEVPAEHPELFKGTDYPGADATKLAVSGITGLSVDYFVMINIDGIQKLVDAMGGVTVNINFPIAKGGHVGGVGEEACGVGGYLPIGANQHLNGGDAMWYARSRCNDPDYDYGRMRRQSCLINAIIGQTNPQTMLTRYEAIASAGQDMMSTDIPENLLDDIANLALKVKDAKSITRVVFAQSLDGTPVANEITPGDPDYPAMRTTIAKAIAASSSSSSASASATATSAPASQEPSSAQSSATASSSGELTPSSTSTSGSTENLADVCTFNPTK